MTDVGGPKSMVALVVDRISRAARGRRRRARVAPTRVPRDELAETGESS